jgi:hypothetical protein
MEIMITGAKSSCEKLIEHFNTLAASVQDASLEWNETGTAQETQRDRLNQLASRIQSISNKLTGPSLYLETDIKLIPGLQWEVKQATEYLTTLTKDFSRLSNRFGKDQQLLFNVFDRRSVEFLFVMALLAFAWACVRPGGMLAQIGLSAFLK